jgi:hypothetical protein
VPSTAELVKVRFERGAEGAVTGMRVSSGRLRNPWFKKLD